MHENFNRIARISVSDLLGSLAKWLVKMTYGGNIGAELLLNNINALRDEFYHSFFMHGDYAEINLNDLLRRINLSCQTIMGRGDPNYINYAGTSIPIHYGRPYESLRDTNIQDMHIRGMSIRLSDLAYNIVSDFAHELDLIELSHENEYLKEKDSKKKNKTFSTVENIRKLQI